MLEGLAEHAVAAKQPRHGLKQFPPAVERAHAVGTEHLVGAEGQEIDAAGP